MKNHFNHVNHLNQRLQHFWSARNERERFLLISAFIVAIAAFTYMVAVAPAMQARAQLQKNLPQLRRQAAQLQLWARQAQQLYSVANAAHPSAVSLSREIIEAALARKGLKAQQLSVTDKTVTLQLSGVVLNDALESIEQMQKNFGLFVVDAKITKHEQPARVNLAASLQQ